MTKGKRIKKKREQLGISQTELAQKIGVSKQTLYKYENDIITNIPSNKIELLAKNLCVSEKYLMCWSDVEWDPATQEIYIDSKLDYQDELYYSTIKGVLMKNYIEKISKLPQDMQEYIFKIIDNTYDLYMSSKGGE